MVGVSPSGSRNLLTYLVCTNFNMNDDFIDTTKMSEMNEMGLYRWKKNDFESLSQFESQRKVSIIFHIRYFECKIKSILSQIKICNLLGNKGIIPKFQDATTQHFYIAHINDNLHRIKQYMYFRIKFVWNLYLSLLLFYDFFK